MSSISIQKGANKLMHKPRMILGVIDNNARSLTATKALLDASGFAIISFSSAEEFFISAAKEKIDCLLLDIHLDGLSGIEVRQRLRVSHPALPVIFMSGLDDETTRRRALEADCVAFLPKPFPARQLIDAVEKLRRKWA